MSERWEKERNQEDPGKVGEKLRQMEVKKPFEGGARKLASCVMVLD